MLEVSLEGATRLDSLGRKLRAATEKKMQALTEALYEKVILNVSGKILQTKSGQLKESIHKFYYATGDQYLGSVYVEPVTPKALALEKGGTRNYIISPVKAQVLRFIAKDGSVQFRHSVNHPPSKAFGYLSEALMEVQAMIPATFADYIQTALNGVETGHGA